MNILIWNVRGLNDPLKQKRVVDRIRSMKIMLVGLLETRVKEYNSQSIINKYFQGWKWAHNYSTAYNGRIWVLCVVYMAHNIQVKELIRGVAEWREGNEQ